MRVQIAPVVTEHGTKYRLVRRRFIGRLLLTDLNTWRAENDRYWGIWSPAEFNTPMRAAEKVRELYGRSAIIEAWTG